MHSKDDKVSSEASLWKSRGVGTLRTVGHDMFPEFKNPILPQTFN
jgi:hypothetical protein